jgi:hypothetical protein
MRMACFLMATALVAAVPNPAAAQSDTFQWTGPIAGGGTLQVQGISGSIRATPSADGQVHVDARIEDPSRVRVNVDEHANGIIVCVAFVDEDTQTAPADCRTSGSRNGGRSFRPAVDIAVQVPDGIRFAAAMVSGDITAEDLREDVHATTVSGDVRVQSAGFPITATTVSGDVTVGLDANDGAQLSVTTVSGQIRSDLPMTTASSAGGPGGRTRGGPKGVRATIGGGGADIHATTVSGDITVRRR